VTGKLNYSDQLEKQVDVMVARDPIAIKNYCMFTLILFMI